MFWEMLAHLSATIESACRMIGTIEPACRMIWTIKPACKMSKTSLHDEWRCLLAYLSATIEPDCRMIGTIQPACRGSKTSLLQDDWRCLLAYLSATIEPACRMIGTIKPACRWVKPAYCRMSGCACLLTCLPPLNQLAGWLEVHGLHHRAWSGIDCQTRPHLQSAKKQDKKRRLAALEVLRW